MSCLAAFCPGCLGPLCLPCHIYLPPTFGPACAALFCFSFPCHFVSVRLLCVSPSTRLVCDGVALRRVCKCHLRRCCVLLLCVEFISQNDTNTTRTHFNSTPTQFISLRFRFRCCLLSLVPLFVLVSVILYLRSSSIFN